MWIFVLIYLAPTIIAYIKKIPRRDEVLLFNVFFGWTIWVWFFLVWVVWAEGEE